MRLWAKLISLISISLIILANSSYSMYIPRNSSSEEPRASLNKSNLDQNSVFKFFASFGPINPGESKNVSEYLIPIMNLGNMTNSDADGRWNISESIQHNPTHQLDERKVLERRNDSINPNTTYHSSKHGGNVTNQKLRRKRDTPKGNVLLQQPLAPSTRTLVPQVRITSNKPYELPNTCPATTRKVNRTLGCYQCNSTYLPGKKQKDELCDHVLWGVTSAKEKYIFRTRCPEEGGFYCVKKVQEIAGKRVTQRGCMGPGPVKTDRGDKVTLKIGCVSYRQHGYITTTCLCDKGFCNAAPRTSAGILHLGLVILMTTFVYSFSTLAFQTQVGG